MISEDDAAILRYELFFLAEAIELVRSKPVSELFDRLDTAYGKLQVLSDTLERLIKENSGD